MKKFLYGFLSALPCLFIGQYLRAQSLCSATTSISSVHGCTYEYFSAISASGTGVSSTIDVSGITSCTGYWFPDYSGVYAMGITAVPGSTVDMHLNRLYDPGYTAKASVWIDWNNNETYESSELCGTETTWNAGAALADSVMTYSFVVPTSGVVTGTHLHMRLFLWDNTGSPPCSNAYGTAYDFWFQVCEPVPIAVTPTAASMCAGSTGIGLTASGAGVGGTYTWAPATGLTATTGPSVTASPGVTTVYTLTGTTSLGCSDTATSTITVNPLPGTIAGSLSVCLGATSVLTDGGAGTWASSNPGVASIGLTSGTVSGVAAGTATITYTLGSGCHTTAVVTVNPVPSPIHGVMKLCAAGATSLTDSTGGGTWSSNNTSVATVGTTGSVSGVAAGTDAITYTSALGCTAEATVTVNPLPALISGANHLCRGFSTLLTDATSGGNWSSSNFGVANVLGGNVIAVSAGSTTISYTLSTGCYTTLSFTVNAGAANISGTPKVCDGHTTGLSDATTGGSWSSTNTLVATVGTDGTVSGVSAGTTVISYSTGAGCPAIVTVTVFPLPSAITGPATACTGAMDTLADATSGGTWSDPAFTGIATVGMYSGAVTGVAQGTAAITYTLAAGCETSVVVLVNPSPAAITGTMQLCPASSVTLGDVTSSGTWSSSGGAISVNSGGTVSGLVAGTATVSYILATGCFASAGVTVNPDPAAIQGQNYICPGYTADLSDSVSGGSWTGTGSGVATVGVLSGVVTGVSAGTIIVSYTLPTGCSAETTFTVNLLPANISGPASLCAGQMITLSDATSGGVWSSSGSAGSIGSASGAVTGVASGTIVVTYTSPAGCIATATVTVNPLPSLISGSYNACAGSDMLLTDSTSDGVWSSSSASVLTVGSATGIVAGVSEGTAIVSYTLATGCAVARTELVNPLPNPVTGYPVLCQYYTTTLNDTYAGGSWSTASALATVGSGTGVVTGVSGGTALITYSLATGCFKDYEVTINPAPASITGGTNVCLGFTIDLNDSTSGGLWGDPGYTGTASVSGTGAVTGLAVGSAVVTYILTTGCFTTATVNVNPIPPAITGAPNVCERDSIALSDFLTGGTWSSNNTGIATAGSTSGFVTGVTTGTTLITYTSATGCTTSRQIQVILSPSLIGGATDVCTGMTAEVTDSTGGGTWSSTGSSLTATVGSTGMVTGVSGGTIIVTYTINTGCFSTQQVAISQLPGAITGAAGFCSGSSTMLADSISGGTWHSSATTTATVDSAGDVRGVSAGTAVITYSTGVSCNALVTVTVMPLIAPLSGTDSLCKGATVTLHDAIPGGNWSSSAISIAGVSGSGVVIGNSPGTAIISYSAPNTCDTSIFPVKVNALPNAGTIVGNSVLCTGVETTLADAAAGGMWSSVFPAIAVLTAPGVFTGIAPGTDTIYYTVVNACGTAVAKLTVAVGETPDSVAITTFPPADLCANTQFQNFGAAKPAVAGTSYTWTAHNAEIYSTSPGQQYCLVNFNTAGHASVKLSSGTGGCYSADSLSFTVSNFSSPDPSVVYNAPELICTDNTANTYQWGYDNAITLDSTLIPGAVNQNYQLPNPDFVDRYYWVITNHSGCLQKSYYNQPAIAPAMNAGGITMKVYPNPADAGINVVFDGYAQPVEVTIFDAVGEKMKSVMVTTSGFINLSGLTPGAYLVVAEAGGMKAGRATFIKK